MAGIGEASGVITFLQVGFSIATTLTTYIADVRDSRDDVQTLANEIDATLRHLEELNRLLDSNDRTNGWNENGVKLAQKCRTDSEKIVYKLVKLLRKSGTEYAPDKILGRADIDISKFHQASWPLFKPRVEVVKRELERTRIDILLARDLYKASAEPSSTERKNARDRIAGLSRSKAEVSKQLRQAKRKQKQAARPPLKIRFEEPDTSRLDRQPSRRSTFDSEDKSDDDSSSVVSVSSSLIGVIKEDLRDEILEQIRKDEREARAKAEAAEQERAQANISAVDSYKQALMKALTDREKEAEQLTKRLTEFFEPSLPPEQIQRYVQEQQSRETNDEIKKLMLQFQSSGVTQALVTSEQTELGLIRTKNSSVLSDAMRTSSRRKSKHRPGSNGIPSALLRQEQFADCARTLSITTSYDGERWIVVPVHIPMHWLVQRMNVEEKRNLKRIGGMSESMKTFSELPMECRTAANEWLDQNAKSNAIWSLVFAEAKISEPSKTRRVLQRMLSGSSDSKTIHSAVLVYRPSHFAEGPGRGKATGPTEDGAMIEDGQSKPDHKDGTFPAGTLAEQIANGSDTEGDSPDPKTYYKNPMDSGYFGYPTPSYPMYGGTGPPLFHYPPPPDQPYSSLPYSNGYTPATGDGLYSSAIHMGSYPSYPSVYPGPSPQYSSNPFQPAFAPVSGPSRSDPRTEIPLPPPSGYPSGVRPSKYDQMRAPPRPASPSLYGDWGINGGSTNHRDDYLRPKRRDKDLAMPSSSYRSHYTSGTNLAGGRAASQRWENRNDYTLSSGRADNKHGYSTTVDRGRVRDPPSPIVHYPRGRPRSINVFGGVSRRYEPTDPLSRSRSRSPDHIVVVNRSSKPKEPTKSSIYSKTRKDNTRLIKASNDKRIWPPAASVETGTSDDEDSDLDTDFALDVKGLKDDTISQRMLAKYGSEMGSQSATAASAPAVTNERRFVLAERNGITVEETDRNIDVVINGQRTNNTTSIGRSESISEDSLSIASEEGDTDDRPNGWRAAMDNEIGPDDSMSNQR